MVPNCNNWFSILPLFFLLTEKTDNPKFPYYEVLITRIVEKGFGQNILYIIVLPTY